MKSRKRSPFSRHIGNTQMEIWEIEGPDSSDINDDNCEEDISVRFRERPHFNLDYIDWLTFNPKGLITYSEAFAHL